MFVKNKDYDTAIQKIRIEVGTILGLEEDKEAYMVLKELPTREIMNLRNSYNEGETAVMDFFKGVLPNLIVDHNFYIDEQTKMTNEEVADLVFEKIELSTKVMNDYSNTSLFTQTSKKESK